MALHGQHDDVVRVELERGRMIDDRDSQGGGALWRPEDETTCDEGLVVRASCDECDLVAFLVQTGANCSPDRTGAVYHDLQRVLSPSTNPRAIRARHQR